MTLLPKSSAAPKTQKKPESRMILDSCRVEGYRCFKKLDLTNLAEVNLILGRNNVGKTALLEAIYIFAKNGNNDALINILLRREELSKVPRLGPSDQFESWTLSNLFRNRPSAPPTKLASKRRITIDVASITNPKRKVTVGFFKGQGNEPFVTALQTHGLKRFPAFFLGTGRLNDRLVGRLWKAIEMTDKEDFVLESLKILSDEVLSVRLMDDPAGRNFKVPFARIASSPKPVRLKSLGYGVNRLFEILLLVVNCKNGMLLIDEIESGIHHLAIPEVWNALIAASKKHNVQIFLSGSGENSASTLLDVAGNNVSKAVFNLDRRDGEVVLTAAEKRPAAAR